MDCFTYLQCFLKYLLLNFQERFSPKILAGENQPLAIEQSENSRIETDKAIAESLWVVQYLIDNCTRIAPNSATSHMKTADAILKHLQEKVGKYDKNVTKLNPTRFREILLNIVNIFSSLF